MKKLRPAYLLGFSVFIFFSLLTIGTDSSAEESRNEPGPLYKIRKDVAPFSLAWKIAYRGTDIGYSVSRFSFTPEKNSKKGRSGDVSYRLMKEEGIKRFDIDLGIIKISYSEKTATTWDGSGLIVSFSSTIEINGSIEKRYFKRSEEGAGILKIIKGDKIREVSHTIDDFDFTSGDLYLKGFLDKSGNVTYKIMSLADGKVGSLSYTFIGRERIAATNGTEECLKIDIVGRKGGGIFLINDMGIALYFKIQFPLGDFSFTPTDLAEAETAILN